MNSNKDFEAIVSDMLTKASKIGKDRNISEELRDTSIHNLRQQALQQLQEAGKQEIERLTTRRDQLVKASKAPFAPSVGEANQALYIKLALEAKYQNIHNEEDRLTSQRHDWQESLASDDLVTARVFRDFYPKYNEDLVEETQKRILRPETQQARKELPPAETALLMTQGDLNEAMIQIEHSQFRPDGTIVDGQMVMYQSQARYTF